MAGRVGLWAEHKTRKKPNLNCRFVCVVAWSAHTRENNVSFLTSPRDDLESGFGEHSPTEINPRPGQDTG